MMNFVNALNALSGRVWLGFIAVLLMLLVYARYRKVEPTGSIVDSLNAIHVALFGFTLCLCAIALILAGHEAAADKIFLSGASFIGGVAVKTVADMARNVNGNGTGNDAVKVPNAQV